MTTVNSSIDAARIAGVESLAASAARAGEATLRDGTRVHVRPIHPADINLERHLIESLSPESRRFRFLDTLNSPSEALLKQLTVINPATDAAYVALLGAGDQAQEIGVARFSAQADGRDCEFALTRARPHAVMREHRFRCEGGCFERQYNRGDYDDQRIRVAELRLPERAGTGRMPRMLSALTAATV